MDFKDKESQCAILCLENILHYELPENIHIQLVALKPKVEELAMFGRELTPIDGHQTKLFESNSTLEMFLFQGKACPNVSQVLALLCILFIFFPMKHTVG